jgi:hypothetical protein
VLGENSFGNLPNEAVADLLSRSGFCGSPLSFQEFPAHIHNHLTISLAETHVVHTKLYPRYKSRKAIEFARDDFGTWSAFYI